MSDLLRSLMTRRVFWTAALAFAVMTPFARAQEPAKEAETLDGTWKVVALRAEGNDAPADAFRTWRWEIKDKKIVMSAEGEEPIEATVVLHPSKSPAAIDMTALSGPTKGKKAQGIYELKKETLRICLADFDAVDAARPTEFDGGAGKGLITLERIKKP
jgi:uncharacterized protein (TIGR03067 family)